MKKEKDGSVILKSSTDNTDEEDRDTIENFDIEDEKED